MALGKLSRAKLPKEVKKLVNSCREFLRLLEDEMKQPSSPNRGRRIAELSNALEMAVDSIEHFGIKELRKKTEAPR